MKDILGLALQHVCRQRALGPAEGAGIHGIAEFGWPSPQCRGRLGAAHGVELPFVFGNLHTQQGLELTGPAPPATLAEAMHPSWVGFAQKGDPAWAPHAGEAPPVRYFGAAPSLRAASHERALVQLCDGLL